MNSYGNLPSNANKEAVESFRVNIPDADLLRMHTLLTLSNVASPCYENSLPGDSRHLGLRQEWLAKAKTRWETKFDWRTHEEQINSFPNFKVQVPVEGSQSAVIGVHFAALFSQNPAAQPLLLLHGWPGSFLEFLPMLSLLKRKYPDPGQLPYHIVVPSLPGYAFSEPLPIDRDFGLEDVARIMDHLMVQHLGFTGYITQAGDVGSRIGRIMCAQLPTCAAVLLNYSPVPAPPGFDNNTLTTVEKRGVERAEWFKTHGSAYAMEQATKPATLGLALSASPLALLAWVGEKFVDWTDPASFPNGTVLMDEAILSVSLYWLTGHAHTCFYSYRESYSQGGKPVKSHASPEYHIHAPKKLGFSYFPMELVPTPRSWIETSGNLIFWREHEKGGHFAALEQSETLLGDLEEFVKVVNKSG